MSFKNIKITLAFLLLVSFCTEARENINIPDSLQNTTNKTASQELMANCDNPTASFQLDINNVRATIHNGGDMWWDLSSNAEYFVPADGNVSSMFASAVWVGGIDPGGQLKLAAQTYRQSGVDFWPGPLDNNASITSDECKSWDKMFILNQNADDQENPWHDFIQDAQDGSIDNSIPPSVLNWPAKGNPNITLDDKYNSRSYSLAPFKDTDDNGIYEPSKGDYPVLADRPGWHGARPDQLAWWVYNDKGDIHTETSAQPIGIEIQARAFAFSTNDALNNMTFYSYKLINRGSTTLDSTFIAQWVDSDLGAFDDDYVGCDTATDLGICYNGDKVDGPTSPNYGEEVPMVGTDFFEGPRAPNKGDSGETVRLGMSTFLYYNNDFSQTGNPTSAAHYYGYMTGTWKDGTPFTCGGNGYGGRKKCDYIFPSPPDEPGWSECSEDNQPFDRRYLQSSGPFTLKPGAVNNVTIGVVWVPDQNYPCPSFQDIKIADRKAQALFDNNFQLISGPDAPTLNIREMNQKLILSLKNDSTSNNFAESYKQVDPKVKAEVERLAKESNQNISPKDSFYIFQGYKIYQVKNKEVSVTDLGDPDKSRLVAQIDRQDSLEKLVNWTENATIGELVPELQVNSANKGIRRTFEITNDLFAAGDRGLVNHKTYYFTAVAYAANRYRKFSPNDSLPGQKIEYLEGVNNVRTYSAKPHMIHGQNGGMKLNAEYGDAPKVKRIEGQGNGNQILEITDTTELRILQNNSVDHPVYKPNNAPVEVMIFDPTQVPDAKFRLAIKDTVNFSVPNYKVDKSSQWKLTNLKTGESIYSKRAINKPYNQVIEKWGLLVGMYQVPSPSKNPNERGFLDAEIQYKEGLQSWLSGLNFEEGSEKDWIEASPGEEAYEQIINGSWTPYALCNADSSQGRMAPALQGVKDTVSLDGVPNVDVVLTPNKSNWSKCVVVEAHHDSLFSEHNETNCALRMDSSWTKDGDYTGTKGFSWFPGYAINLETGERLNIMFAEDSRYGSDNGRDMIWNPTSRETTPTQENVLAGEHYIYVMNSTYDGCSDIHDKLMYHAIDSHDNKKRYQKIRSVYSQATWVGAPRLEEGSELLSTSKGIIPNKARVKLRLAQPYKKYAVGNRNSNLPLYTFSTSDYAVDTGLQKVAKNALDSMHVVPNPYYSYSPYESGQLDREVKITNLPSNAEVKIFTVKGTLVREFQRSVGDNTSSAKDGVDNTLSWDLTNQRDVPVASGIYLIHVNAPDLGEERVLKFFCVMRPTDLSTF